jgi:hypothetical protein
MCPVPTKPNVGGVSEQGMLQKLIQAGAIAALITGPAFAQAPQPSQSPTFGVPFKSEKPQTQEDIEKRKALDHAYDAAIQKIPEKKPSADPWGNIRPSSPTASKNKQQ